MSGAIGLDYLQTKFEEEIVRTYQVRTDSFEAREGIYMYELKCSELIAFCCLDEDLVRYDLKMILVITASGICVFDGKGEPLNGKFVATMDDITEIWADGDRLKITKCQDTVNSSIKMKVLNVQATEVEVQIRDAKMKFGSSPVPTTVSIHRGTPGKVGSNSLVATRIEFDAFLTHDWGMDELNRDNHARVAKIHKILKHNGIETWFDADRLTGADIIQKITSGIDKSRKVVVCLTKNYVEKVNGTNESDFCKREFLYATKHKHLDNIIVLVMEPRMLEMKQWKGQLDFIVGSTLYIDMSTKEQMYDNVDKLVERIKTE